MLLFSPPARHFVIPRVLPSFYHGVPGHCVISCMEKSQTFSRNGATGRGKLRERPEKIARRPFFVSFSPKWSMIRGSYQTDIKRRREWVEKIGHATNRKISAQNRAHEMKNKTISSMSKNDISHGTRRWVRALWWIKWVLSARDARVFITNL